MIVIVFCVAFLLLLSLAVRSIVDAITVFIFVAYSVLFLFLVADTAVVFSSRCCCCCCCGFVMVGAATAVLQSKVSFVSSWSLSTTMIVGVVLYGDRSGVYENHRTDRKTPLAFEKIFLFRQNW
jgi:hypothetical protein